MTMIEAIMPVASPMSIVGPGFINSGGGACDFRPSLSFGVAARFGDTEQVLKNQARDLATAKSEIEGNPIDPYQLLVKKVQYRNKVTDKIVTEKTLVDGIFEEPISIWSDAGENGTGTKEEYQEILGRARELAATKGKATMFWVSSGKDREDGKPEHRAYLWKKDEQGSVAAYAYQLTGSSDSLSRMLNLLSAGGIKEAEAIDAHTLLWRDTKENVSHERVFSACASALTPKEREQKYDFLQRFKNEAQQPDSVLWGRIESYKNQYQEKLHNAYEGDIQAALEKVAPGLIALASTRIEEAISQITVEEVRPLTRQPIPLPEQLIHMLSPLVPAYLGVLHDTGLHDTSRHEGEIGKEKMQTVKDRDKETDKKRIEVGSVERFAQQVITPIIPGLIEIVANIAMLPEDTLDTTSSPEFMAEVHLSHKFRAILSNPPSRSPSGHLEGVAKRRFLPGEVDRDDETLHSYCETCEGLESVDNFHESVENDYSNFLKLALPEVNHEFRVISPDYIQVSSHQVCATHTWCVLQNRLADKNFITDLREMLETIIDSGVVVIRSEEEKEVTRIGEELTSLTQAILTVVYDNGKTNTSTIETFDQIARLAIFLSIYSEENISAQAQLLLTAFIYHEMKSISTNQQLLDQYPQLNIFIKRFDRLAKPSFIFDGIFAVLIVKLSQLLNIEEEKISEDVLFILYYLVRLQLTGSIYSFERLPSIGKMGVPRLKYGQKRNKQFPCFGVIYRSARRAD